MYKIINGMCFFSESFKGRVLHDPLIQDFYTHLVETTSIGTARTYIGLVHKFWIYSIYFPPRYKFEIFEDYILRYKRALTANGFVVRKKSTFNNNKNITIHKFDRVNSIYQDMVVLEQYFDFMIQRKFELQMDSINTNTLALDFYFDELDVKSFEQKQQHSKGKGYGLKARGIMKTALARRKTVFSKYKKTKSSSKKSVVGKKLQAFPLDAFDLLLDETKNLRSKLLYLLCGATSARISQALALTVYDIDIKNQEVYLLNPLSKNAPRDTNNEILFNQPPRVDLLKKHGLDFSMTPLDKIGHKSFIPSEDSKKRSLHFLHKKYKTMFFDIFMEWREKLDKNNPMVFQTHGSSKHNVLLPSSATTLLIGDLKRFDAKHPTYNVMDIKKKFHAFRHMFGCCMADLAYMFALNNKNNEEFIDLNGEKVNTVKEWILFTKKAMGHKHKETTEIYFNISEDVEKYMADKIMSSDNFTEALREKSRIRELVMKNESPDWEDPEAEED